MSDVISNQIELVEDMVETNVTFQMKSRGFRVANELRNASQLVLRGQRSGKRYNVPGTGRIKYNKRKKTATITYKKYTASAPGEAPAVRTGTFRNSWKPRVFMDSTSSKTSIHAVIESGITVNGHKLGDILEEGTPNMAPRPYKEAILKKAYNKAVKIYKEPYV